MSSSALFTPNSVVTVCVPPDRTSGLRIDKYLSEHFSLYSRTFFARLIADKAVAVNGKTTTKSSLLVQAGDTIALTIPAQPVLTQSDIKKQTAAIQILYEHTHFLILNKPAGIAVHKGSSHTLVPTLTDWITLHYADIAHVGSIDRPGIVHRLDKDTSGLIVIARTNYAHTVFTDLFKNRAIKKTYLAIVHGHPSKTGIIDLSIARHPVHRKKMMTYPVEPTEQEKNRSSTTIRHALTLYTVDRYFAKHSLLIAKPVTGRTHQIRVHLSAINHPLLGDATYGTPSPLIPYHALHAQELSFSFDGTPFTFSCPPPEPFQVLVKLLSE